MVDQFNSPMQNYDGWNMNASYMTPAYMSNFRPSYNAGGVQNSFGENRSVGSSAFRMGPGDHAYGRNVMQDAEFDRYNITTGVGDAGMSLFQNVGIPAAAWTMSSAVLGSRFGGSNTAASRMGAGMGRGAMRGMTGAAGRGMGMMGMGGAAARGAGVAGNMARGAGAAGGMMGSMFLPLMAAQAIGGVADSALIDPYVSTRRGMDAMRANTANQYVSGPGGAAGGGFGMSATRSQEISQALTVAGQKDLMLGGGDFNEIADNMMRAGIFQEVGDMDASKVVDGVKKATSVLKLIQRITGDPDIKNGIETLAKLKSGGLDDIQQMGVAVNRLRGASASSGVGMKQLMDTIGSQGSVMAQQQGISATTGLLASADAFAGFTSARRAGLISGTEAAGLGGTEGMTQNLMSGAYQALNSGMGRMAMQGGGFGNGMVGTISGFGKNFSKDPMNAEGDWFMNKGKYMEDAINNRGAGKVTIEQMKTAAVAMGGSADSDYDLALAARSMGLSSEQFRAIAISDRASSDPRSQMNSRGAERASATSNRVTELQNNFQGMRGIPVLGDMQQMWNEGSRSVLGAGAEAMGPVTEVMAGISDKWASGITSLKGIESAADQARFVDTKDGRSSRVRYAGKKRFRQGLTGPNRSKLVDDPKYDALFTRLNQAGSSSDTTISDKERALRTAINDGDTAEASKLYRELDVALKGYLTDTSEAGFERDYAYEQFDDAVARGKIATESDMTMDKSAPSRTIQGELIRLGAISDPKKKRAAAKKLMKERGGELAGAVGILPGDLSGKSEAGQKTQMLDKLMSDKSGVDEIHTQDEFMKRFMEMGYTKDQISDTISRSTRSFDDILKDHSNFNPMNDDVREQTVKFAQDIEASNAATKREAASKGTGTNWDNLRDVTEGIGALGPVLVGNTTAIEANTAAQVAVLNSREGTNKKVSDFYAAPPTEPSVGLPGATKNTNVQGYR